MSYEIDGRTNGPAITWPGRARIAVMVTFDFDAGPGLPPKVPPSDSRIIPGASTVPAKV